MTAVNMDQVARGLGVGSDDGIVSELSAALVRLDMYADGIYRQIGLLDSAVPEACDALDRSLNALLDAYQAVQAVRSAAEDHVRGDQ